MSAPGKKRAPASFVRRLAARVVDGVVVAFLCYLPARWGPGLPEYVLGYVGFIFRLTVRTPKPGGLDPRVLAEVAAWVGAGASALGYFVMCEARGQTIGKRALGTRVVPEKGSFVTSGQALGRALGLVVSVLPLGIGALAMLWEPQRRTWHDRMTGTRVVRAYWPDRVPLARPVLTTAALSLVFAVVVPTAILVYRPSFM